MINKSVDYIIERVDAINNLSIKGICNHTNRGGGHNVSIGDTKAKKIIEKDRIIIELEQSSELYKQKIESLETR